MNLNSSIIAAGCGATQLRSAQWAQPIQAACDRFEINTPMRIAAFMAEIGVESGRLVYTKEIWGPTEEQMGYEGRTDLGNTELGDGERFMGRGLIQVTGRRNYLLCGIGIDLDLINHPELLEQPVDAALSAAWYWFNRKLNAYADAGQFLQLSKAINCGSANSTRTPNGYSQRLALYAAAKQSLGIA